MSNTKKAVKLKGKDLITIGIFSALYFVLSLICNMLGGIHAIVWFLSPAIAALVCSIPFMILAAKVKKPFGILVMSIVVGLIYLITGQFHIAVTIVFIIGGVIAELIRFATKYKRYWADACGFAFISLGMVASPLPLWIDTDAFIKQITNFGMPESYINTCLALTSPMMFVVMIVLTIIGAFIGALIAKSMFKKHFKKAGVIA